MNFKPPVLAPSILAADYTCLGNQIKQCTQAGISWIHCDVMDGHFVPNISYGPVIVKAARSAAPEAFLDVHLMIENPGQYIEPFVKAGADLLTVHQETCPHLHRVVQQIKHHQIKAGVAINPATSLYQIEPILEYVDLVLIMSVNPGFGGQKFIEPTYRKLDQICSLRKKTDAPFLIEVDGGIGLKNIQKIAKTGADIFVAGSAVFKNGDIGKQVDALTTKARAGYATYV